MGNEINLDTLKAILDEVDKACDDKSRVISDIQNRDAQRIIQQYSDSVLGAGVVIGSSGAAGGIASGISGAAAGGAAGSLIAGGTAAGSALAGGETTMFISGSSAAAAGGAAGGAAGSAVPIIGTLIGAGLGLLIGWIIGSAITAKQKEKREILYQEAIKKQNEQIHTLLDEVKCLQDNKNKTDEKIVRLEYLLGVLSAFTDARVTLENSLNAG